MNHPVQETSEPLEGRQKQAPLDPEEQNSEALYRAIVNTIPDGITQIEQGRATLPTTGLAKSLAFPVSNM
jgi:hypothetical protein